MCEMDLEAPPPSGALGQRWRPIVVLTSLALAAEMMLYGSVAPLLPRYVSHFDLSKAQAGALVGAYSAGLLAGGIPFGIAAARLGAQRALVTGLLMLAAGSLGFGFAGSFEVLVAARLVQGAGAAAAWAGGLTWIGKLASGSNRGELIGIAVGAGVAGQIGGPALGSVAALTSPAAVFSSYAGLTALIAVAAWRRSGPRVIDQVSSRDLFAWVGRPGARSALGLFLVFSLAVGVYEVLIPLELRARDVTAVAIGGLFMAAALGTALASRAVGRWSDRRGRLAPIVAGFVSMTMATVVITLPLSLVVYAPMTFMLLLSVNCGLTPTLANISDATAHDEGASEAMGWGISICVAAAAMLAGSLGGSASAQAHGDHVTLILLAATFVLTLGTIFLSEASRRRSAGHPPTGAV